MASKTAQEILLEQNPFNEYVSRSDRPDMIDIERPHIKADNAILTAVRMVKQGCSPRIIPILGEAGYGKTHVFWTLRRKLTDCLVVYVSPPPTPERVIPHFYFSLLREIGLELLQKLAEHVFSKYETFEEAVMKHPGPETWIIQALHALTTTNPSLRKQAKKWFAGIATGQAKVPEESLLDDDELALAALRVLLKYIDIPVVFFVDELETTYLAFGSDAQVRFLESIKRIYNECKNHIIILACITELYDRVLELVSPSVQGRMERPVLLRRFTREDIGAFVKRILGEFWKQHGIEVPSPLFPLQRKDIDKVTKKSRGNPREVIRWLRDTIELSKLAIFDKNDTTIREDYMRARELADLIREQLSTVGVSVVNKGTSGAVIVFSPRNKPKKVAVISGSQNSDGPFLQEVLEAFNNDIYDLFTLSGSLNGHEEIKELPKDLSDAAQTIISVLSE